MASKGGMVALGAIALGAVLVASKSEAKKPASAPPGVIPGIPGIPGIPPGGVVIPPGIPNIPGVPTPGTIPSGFPSIPGLPNIPGVPTPGTTTPKTSWGCELDAGIPQYAIDMLEQAAKDPNVTSTYLSQIATQVQTIGFPKAAACLRDLAAQKAGHPGGVEPAPAAPSAAIPGFPAIPGLPAIPGFPGTPTSPSTPSDSGSGFPTSAAQGGSGYPVMGEVWFRVGAYAKPYPSEVAKYYTGQEGKVGELAFRNPHLHTNYTPTSATNAPNSLNWAHYREGAAVIVPFHWFPIAKGLPPGTTH